MARTFQIVLYTPHDIGTPQISQQLWELLNDPLIDPQRYGSVERAKHLFDSAAHNEGSRIYRTNGMLFVRGSKDSFLAMFMRQFDGQARWIFWWDVKAMTRRRDAWLDWLFALCRRLPVHYGLGCTVAEYEAKHTVVEDVPGGGTATRMAGTSATDFYEYLPGVYWLSIFGPLLTAHFSAKLRTLAGTTSVTLGSAGTALLMDEPVVPKNLDDRLQAAAAIRASLGARYFFDLAANGMKYEAVPQLIQALPERSS